jgi:hypothetical protein
VLSPTLQTVLKPPAVAEPLTYTALSTVCRTAVRPHRLEAHTVKSWMESITGLECTYDESCAGSEERLVSTSPTLTAPTPDFTAREKESDSIPPSNSVSVRGVERATALLVTLLYVLIVLNDK